MRRLLASRLFLVLRRCLAVRFMLAMWLLAMWRCLALRPLLALRRCLTEEHLGKDWGGATRVPFRHVMAL